MTMTVPSQSRPVVLTFVRHYLPSYKSGGPVRTIANMVEALGDEFEFRVVTSDRDATDTAPFPNIQPDSWNAVGKAKVFYLSPPRRMERFRRLMGDTRHDIVYLNSFFDPDFTITPLVARRFGQVPRRPWIIAPRGEFSDGALRIRAWKKRPFKVVARLSGLYRGLSWQASSIHEEQDIQKAMGVTARRVLVAMDLPSQFSPTTREQPDARGCIANRGVRICFVSRISPMKNLDFALRVLKRVRQPIVFDIFGPVRDEAYWEDCQALMARLPSHVTATYRGVLEHADVASTIASYDFFFLPTRGENYGHVIAEALGVGTPVLIADTTPWRDLAAHGVGWDLPLDEQLFADRIEALAGLDQTKYREMRARAVSFAANHARDPVTVEANRRLFLHALGDFRTPI